MRVLAIGLPMGIERLSLTGLMISNVQQPTVISVGPKWFTSLTCGNRRCQNRTSEGINASPPIINAIVGALLASGAIIWFHSFRCDGVTFTSVYTASPPEHCAA